MNIYSYNFFFVEIINGKGYTYSVDLWSVGICLYEFMCGGVPFAEEAEDPYEIYEEIIRKNVNLVYFYIDFFIYF